MKHKLLVRMMGALLLMVFVGHGHASRRCVANKSEIVAPPSILATPAVHFAPMDIFKW